MNKDEIMALADGYANRYWDSDCRAALSAAIDEVLAERDALKSECKCLRAELGDLPEAQAEMLSEIKRLKAELRKLTP